MLTPFDDYPVHQTPDPVAHVTGGDRNFYDRYFFNGYRADGSLFFAFALGVYPNRGVMDASASVVVDGRQISLHASRAVGADRSQTRVGPIEISVEVPLQVLRVRVLPNDFGIEADLRFRARGVPLEEPRFVHRDGHRTILDYTRLTQFGRWDGSLRLNGAELEIRPELVLGCRDRSWGIRPVGEPPGGAPGPSPQFFWLWAPLHFDDRCTHFAVNEDAAGHPWHASGSVLLASGGAPGEPGAPGEVQRMRSVSHAVRWAPGSRRAASAELTLSPREGPDLRIELTPILSFQMLGLGYLHPEWGHGFWKGPLEVGGESWRLADLDPLEPRHVHVQQLCHADMGGQVGSGILEQLVIGPHAPSGFASLFDPAR